MTTDRGAADALGLVLIVPVALAIAALVLWIGRTTDSQAQVRAASAAAVQAAVRQRTPSTATTAALATARQWLDEVPCVGGPAIDVDAASWQPGAVVTVTVTCRPDSSDLAVVGASPRLVRGSSTAVIDRYRAGALP